MQLKSISQLSTINFYDFKELLSTEVSSATGEISSPAYLELAYYNKVKDTNAATNFDSYKLPFTSLFGWMVKEISELYKYVDTSLCEISTKIVHDFSVSCDNISATVNERLGHYVFATPYNDIADIHGEDEVAKLHIRYSKLFESTVDILGATHIESTLTVDLKAQFNNGITITNGGAKIEGDVNIVGNLTCTNADTLNITNHRTITSLNVDTCNLTCSSSVAKLTAEYALWG